MKLGAVTRLHKRNTSTSKNFDDNVMLVNCDVIVFFRFTANLQPSRNRIPDSWSIKLTYSLIVTFYPTEPETN